MLIRKGLIFSIVAVVLLMAGAALAAEKKEIKGQLVTLNSRDNSMTLEVEVKGLMGPEKRYMNFKIASDAKWHICLAERCVDKVGADGFRTVNEYANFEAYGIPLKSYKVTLNQAGDMVTALRVEIVPGKHKE